MEMVKGGSLIDLMNQSGPQSAAIAGPIMLGALAGLQASHDRGVIHRDIKPHNMLMTLEGVVKITDFGIANMQEDERSFTKTGAVMGTLAYMPPEQRQSAKGLGPTADVFAAGASLYALLTGQEPFDLYNEGLHDRLFAGLPDSLSKLVAKACSYDPADRYQSASSMSADLHIALNGLGVQIAPDYRVSLGTKSDGTMFFDPEESVSTAPFTRPVARVEATTIHPKETFFPSDMEASADVASSSLPKIPLKKKVKWASVVVRLGLVFLLGGLIYSVVDSPELMPEASKASIQDAPPEVKAATEKLSASRALVEAELEEAPPPVAAPPVAAPPTRSSNETARRPAPRPPEPEPTPVVAPAPVVAAPTPSGPAMLGVNSVPPGRFSIDGQRQGKMKLRRVEVSPGRHTIGIEVSGEDGSVRTKEIPITINAGETKTVCWNFNTGANCR